jgi:hypothetical protein
VKNQSVFQIYSIVQKDEFMEIRENRVVILGAGIGAIAMGFENASCKVVAAYEHDERARELYENNAKDKTYKIGELDYNNFEEIPDMDILACDFRRGLSFTSAGMGKTHHFRNAVKAVIEFKQPKKVFFLVQCGYARLKPFKALLDYLKDEGYNYSYRIINTEGSTGLPIKEDCVYLIGTRDSSECELKFPDFEEQSICSINEILESDEVDGYYYKVNYEQIDKKIRKNTFLCWEKNQYVEANLADTNLRKIPLICNNGVIRKITHREFARLKAIPDSFNLDISNKAWMYRQLVYSPNVEIVTQIAKKLGNTEENLLRTSYVVREDVFADIFRKYLFKKCQSVKIGKSVDFECNVQGKDICFELKIYNSNYAIEKNIERVCAYLVSLKAKEDMILVVGNIVSKEIVEKYFEKYKIHIWTLSNILWLFEEYPDIKNEFISLLTYSVDDLKLEKPCHSLFQEQRNKKNEGTWKSKLLAIKPGKGERSKEYEDICVEILKNVLGEYLGLWKVQESSNNGLYRFDLCCKIKNGVNQDFFDTIKNYFNTKYIVFEFKNYEKEISQKEIYTTEKYLYEKALRRVAIIISRKGASKNALSAARGCLRENGKLIMCLSDQDLIELINIKEKEEQPTAEFFEVMLDDLLIQLEK